MAYYAQVLLALRLFVYYISFVFAFYCYSLVFIENRFFYSTLTINSVILVYFLPVFCIFFPIMFWFFILCNVHWACASCIVQGALYGIRCVLRGVLYGWVQQVISLGTAGAMYVFLEEFMKDDLYSPMGPVLFAGVMAYLVADTFAGLLGMVKISTKASLFPSVPLLSNI